MKSTKTTPKENLVEICDMLRLSRELHLRKLLETMIADELESTIFYYHFR